MKSGIATKRTVILEDPPGAWMHAVVMPHAVMGQCCTGTKFKFSGST
eukprot:SAG31_NODE_879_length_11292_cov_49.116680_10_plen_47_part_00